MINTIIRSLAIAVAFTSLIAFSSSAESADGVRAARIVEQLHQSNSGHSAASGASSSVSSESTGREVFDAVPALTDKSPTPSVPRATTVELVVYESRDCVVSRKFHHEAAADYKISKSGKVFPLRRADIASGPAGVHLKRPVTMTPTFVFVDHGVEIARFAGYPGREHFLKLVDAAAEAFTKTKSAK